MQRLYQGPIADTEIARTTACVWQAQENEDHDWGRDCDDGIGELTLAHRNGVFAPRRTRSRAAIFTHPGTLSEDSLNVLTRNRIGPAIILQPLHFSVLVRHGFYWG